MLNTLEYIETTLGQAWHEQVTDVAAAARLLSDQEQQAFLQRHGADGDALHAALCREIRALSLPPATAS